MSSTDLATLADFELGDELGAQLRSARGRKPKFARFDVLRELNGSDMEMLLSPPEHGVKTPLLTKLRNSHHMLARLLAEGRKAQECSAITGYSPSRISILQRDPAFKDLVSYYAAQAREVYLNVHERLAALGMSTVEELQERLETDPEAFSNRELMELAEMALDRSLTKPKENALVGQAPPVAISINFVEPEKGPVIEGNAE